MVVVVFVVVLGVSGDACVPAGVAPVSTEVGSTTAEGWTEMTMLLPLPVALEIATPTKPTISYVAF